MNESTIKVVGTGSIHVVPDVTRLQIRVRRVFNNYDEAYNCAKENSSWMVKILEYNKLSGALAKTISLDISDNMVSQYKGSTYIGSKKEGYLLTQEIKVDLGIDNVLVNKVVRGVGKFIESAQINIGYTQRDPRPTQLKMLARAVKDAQEKATIMAEAAGRELGEVQSIEYDEKEIHIYSEAREIHSNAEATASTANSLDITPDDLAVSDNVHVVWRLK